MSADAMSEVTRSAHSHIQTAALSIKENIDAVSKRFIAARVLQKIKKTEFTKRFLIAGFNGIYSFG